MSGMPQRPSRLRNRGCAGRHRASSMNLRAGGAFPIPARPGLRAGRPSKRAVMREAGDVVAERRGLQRTHARPGLLPSLRLLRTPGIYPRGGLALGAPAGERRQFLPTPRIAGAAAADRPQVVLAGSRAVVLHPGLHSLACLPSMVLSATGRIARVLVTRAAARLRARSQTPSIREGHGRVTMRRRHCQELARFRALA